MLTCAFSLLGRWGTERWKQDLPLELDSIELIENVLWSLLGFGLYPNRCFASCWNMSMVAYKTTEGEGKVRVKET